ncbi:MAG TPA: hypothetical protein VMB52_00165 [Verrucomicrobiae bacterium]|nr:hypothetical protein [Verrucomicrobiae bacterium]
MGLRIGITKRNWGARPPFILVLHALCGALVAIGSPITWISAQGARPETWMAHTSFSKMLVYTFVGSAPFFESVGFVICILGVLMVVEALIGRWILTLPTALLAIAAEVMWLGLVTHHYNTPNLPNIHELNPANLPWGSLRAGAWMVLAGAMLGLFSSVLLRDDKNGR